jgi:hypothetical protein
MVSLAAKRLIVAAVVKHSIENPHSEGQQIGDEDQPHPGPKAPAPFEGFAHNMYYRHFWRDLNKQLRVESPEGARTRWVRIWIKDYELR